MAIAPALIRRLSPMVPVFAAGATIGSHPILSPGVRVSQVVDFDTTATGQSIWWRPTEEEDM